MANKENNVVLNFKMNGQVQYAQTLKQLNMVMQTAAKEYQNQLLAMGKDADATEKLRAEKQKLEKQLAASSEKVAKLRKEYEDMQNSTTATADDLQKLYNKLLSAENQHTKLEQSMQRVNDGLSEEAQQARAAKEDLDKLKNESKLLEAEQKQLTSAFKLQTAQLGENTSEAEKTELAQRQLAQQMELTDKVVSNLERQLEVSKKVYGENSREVMQLETKLNQAKTEVVQFANKLDGIKKSGQTAGQGLESVNKKLNAITMLEAAEVLQNISDKLIEIGKQTMETSLSFGNSQTYLQANLGLTAKEAEKLNGVVENIFKHGVVESIDEASQAVMLAKQSFGDLNNADLEKLTNQITTIAKRTGTDVQENVNAASRLMKEFGLSGQQAMDLIAAGYQNGLNKSGDFLDTLNEYSPYFKSAGYSAKEMLQIVENGFKNGAMNTDKAADAVKEFQIRLGDGSFEKIMSSFSKETQNTFKKWEDGKATVKDVADSVSKDLNKMTPTEQQKALSILSTQFEDLGIDGAKALFSVGKEFDNVNGKADEMSKKSPGEKWQSALRELQNTLAPIGTDLINSIMPIIENLSNIFDLFNKLPGPVKTFIEVFGGVTAVALLLAPAIAAVALAVTSLDVALLPIIAIVAAVAAAIAGIIVVIQNWGAITDWLKNVWSSFSSWITDTWNKIKSNAETIWNGLKNVLTSVWNGIKATATAVWGGIKAYFTTVLNAYKTIFITVWNAIKTAVVTVWNALKSRATSIFNSIKKVITSVWNSVKSTTSNVWNGIKNTISNIVKGVKNTVSNVFNSLKSTVSNIWNGIKSTITSVVNAIRSVVSNVFNGLKNIVSSAMNKVVSAIKSGWNKAVSFLKSFKLLSVGKNLMDGLIKGIRSKITAVINSVKSVGKKVLDTFTSVFDIHSPSKKTEKIAFWLMEGLSKGIKAHTKAEKAAKEKAQAIIKAFNNDLKDLKLDYSSGEISTTQYVNSLKKLKKEYSNYADGVKKVNAEINKAENKSLKERFAADKKYYADKSKLSSTSLQEELDILNKLAKGYKKNTDERIYFENLAKQKKEEITKQKKKIDEDYLANVKKLNDEYLAEVQKLNDEYEKAVEDRAKSLYNFVGLFDQVKQSEEVTGQQLIANLQGQVDTFRQWTENIKSLIARGVDEGLIEELENMGPQSAAQIAALTTLTDEELNQFVGLWKEKSSLARAQATEELAGMRAETDAQIEQLKEETAKKLEEYQNEWKNSMKSVTGTVKNMAKQMPSIGSLAVSGLISGINSKKAELQAVANEIASIVASINSSASSIPSVPTDSSNSAKATKAVKWNAKGGIFTRPTIFGMNNGVLQGAGEAGPEAVLPLNEETLGAIGKGIASTMAGNTFNIYTQEPVEQVVRRELERMGYRR